MNFIKQQVDAGIKPQKNHFWGLEFLDRKFAVMIEALQHHINEKFPITSPEKRAEFEQKVGFIPMFPVPTTSHVTSSLMGGWELAVPLTSIHKALTWESAYNNAKTQNTCFVFGSHTRTFQHRYL